MSPISPTLRVGLATSFMRAMLNRAITGQHAEAERLIIEARSIIARAECQHRDLSDFEAGRVDALLELASRSGAGAISKRALGPQR